MSGRELGELVTDYPGPELIVRSAVVENLRTRLFFPKNILTMLLEQAGVYQNFSGIVIEAMIKEGLARLFTHRNKHPILAAPQLDLSNLRGDESQRRIETLRHLDTIMDMQGDQGVCGFFNELILHVAFADYFSSDNPPPVSEYFRKGQYRWLSRSEADCALALGGEFFFVEMKNWLKQAQDESTLVADGEEIRVDNPEFSTLFALTHLGKNPVLINRSSSGRLKRRIWGPLGGRVCDLDYLNILDAPRTQGAKDSARFFGIERMINWIEPPSFDGELLDGITFNKIIRRTQDGHRLTMEDMAAMRNIVPENVKSKVRGLTRILYVMAKRHMAQREGRITDRVGWLLAEYALNYLLGARGGYRDPDVLLGYGEGRLASDFPELLRNYRRYHDRHVEAFQERLEILKEWKFLASRSGSYVVRDARQPETWNLRTAW